MHTIPHTFRLDLYGIVSFTYLYLCREELMRALRACEYWDVVAVVLQL